MNRHARNAGGTGAASSGFTLVELVVVLGVIAMVLAIAIPRLTPALAFGQLDSSARHLANYGLSLGSYCALKQENVTFRFDFETGEYYTLRWLDDDTNQLFDDSTSGSGKLFDDTSSTSGTNANSGPVVINTETLLQLGAQENLSQEMLRVKEQFDRSFLRSLQAQARTASRNSGFLADVGPLFDKDFKLKDNEDQNREEVTSGLLERISLPSDVIVESIRVGNTEYSEGQVDIEVTPLGLNQFVVFTLKDSTDEYATVTWDPITGNSHFHRGKQSPTDTNQL